MFNRYFLVLGILVPLLVFPQASTKKKQQLTGIYTDMRYNEEGGDVLGMELYLVCGGRGYFATVQCAGGAPSRPVIVPVQIAGNRVAFRLPEGLPECGISFTGVISAKGLKGRFEGEKSDRWLPRRNGYWQ